jgi:hypothetical protein
VLGATAARGMRGSAACHIRKSRGVSVVIPDSKGSRGRWPIATGWQRPSRSTANTCVRWLTGAACQRRSAFPVRAVGSCAHHRNRRCSTAPAAGRLLRQQAPGPGRACRTPPGRLLAAPAGWPSLRYGTPDRAHNGRSHAGPVCDPVPGCRPVQIWKGAPAAAIEDVVRAATAALVCGLCCRVDAGAGLLSSRVMARRRVMRDLSAEGWHRCRGHCTSRA